MATIKVSGDDNLPEEVVTLLNQVLFSLGDLDDRKLEQLSHENSLLKDTARSFFISAQSLVEFFRKPHPVIEVIKTGRKFPDKVVKL
jgi:hypothetical protein